MINTSGILQCSMHLFNFVIITALFRIIVKLGSYNSVPALTFKDLPKYEFSSLYFSSDAL